MQVTFGAINATSVVVRLTGRRKAKYVRNHDAISFKLKIGTSFYVVKLVLRFTGTKAQRFPDF